MRKYDTLDERTKGALKELRDTALVAYSALGFTIEELSQAFNMTDTKIKALSKLTVQRSNTLSLVTAEGRETHWQRVEYIKSMFIQESHKIGCSDEVIDFMLGRHISSSTLSLRKKVDELKAQNNELKNSYVELEELAKKVGYKNQKLQAEIERLKSQSSLWT